MVLSALVCVLALAIAVEAVPGSRRLARLETIPPIQGPWPRVSIVFGARDEEAGVERAVRSHLAQAYPALEVIAVDDRSTDRTSRILARVATEHAPLRVIRVDALPPRWLGKCHALQRGAAAAAGEWLLFTDADVVMEPTALSRALALAERDGLDHLTVAPQARMPGRLLQASVASFGLFFSLFTRPWRIPDPASSAHAGIGAFNLVRASTYRAAGGHEAIRLSVDDDLRLAKVLKRSGARAAFAVGPDLVGVDWYPDVRALVRGLEKGVFAAFDYSLLKALGGSAALGALFLWPVAGLCLGGWTAMLCGGTCMVVGALYRDQARQLRTPAWTVVLFPVCCAIFQWILWRSVVRTLVRGGLDWRGTFYSLRDLRAGLV